MCFFYPSWIYTKMVLVVVTVMLSSVLTVFLVPLLPLILFYILFNPMLGLFLASATFLFDTLPLLLSWGATQFFLCKPNHTISIFWQNSLMLIKCSHPLEWQISFVVSWEVTPPFHVFIFRYSLQFNCFDEWKLMFTIPHQLHETLQDIDLLCLP